MRFALCSLLLLASTAMAAEPSPWLTIKGQVKLPDDVAIPVPAKLDVLQDKPHCLAKGNIFDEKLLVNPKSRGIKNVVVWLRPDNMNPAAKLTANEIHPNDAKRKPEEIVIDQPCCMFVSRITACRVGDTIVVKNPAPVPHNFFWTSTNNGDINVVVPSQNKHVFAKPLVAESSPIEFKCTIHPWMNGYVRIFDNPYFAVTDADGKFEIKDAPAGKYRLVYWHENVGFKDGKAGRFGDPITVEGANNTMEMKATDFNVK